MFTTVVLTYRISLSRTFDSWIETSSLFGLSSATANFQAVTCGTTCSVRDEKTRSDECVQCSQQIAASHVSILEKYRDNIIAAANAKCFSADLLAAFISRVTNGGRDLEGTNGWIPCHNNPSTQCFGIMNMCGISES